MGTGYMYFPFMACEVKGCSGTLAAAHCQNAHSVTLAVRGIVALFSLVKREKELHRQILAFSISHDSQYVRINGHYPVIDDEGNIAYHVHTIHEFSFWALAGKDK